MGNAAAAMDKNQQGRTKADNARASFVRICGWLAWSNRMGRHRCILEHTQSAMGGRPRQADYGCDALDADAMNNRAGRGECFVRLWRNLAAH